MIQSRPSLIPRIQKHKIDAGGYDDASKHNQTLRVAELSNENDKHSTKNLGQLKKSDFAGLTDTDSVASGSLESCARIGKSPDVKLRTSKEAVKPRAKGTLKPAAANVNSKELKPQQMIFAKPKGKRRSLRKTGATETLRIKSERFGSRQNEERIINTKKSTDAAAESSGLSTGFEKEKVRRLTNSMAPKDVSYDEQRIKTLEEQNARLTSEVDGYVQQVGNLKGFLTQQGFDVVSLQKLAVNENLIEQRRKECATEAENLNELLQSFVKEAEVVTDTLRENVTFLPS